MLVMFYVLKCVLATQLGSDWKFIGLYNFILCTSVLCSIKKFLKTRNPEKLCSEGGK